MANLSLEIDQSVEVEVKSGSYTGSYICKVIDIAEDIIQLTLPIKKEAVVPLSVGTRLEVSFSDECAKYSFRTKVLSRHKANNVAVCEVEFPAKVNKIQRRDFVRVPIREEVEYRQLELDDLQELEDEEDKQEDFKLTFTRDISGGGLLLAVQEYISPNSFVELKFDIEDFSFDKVIGEVLRVDQLAEEDEKIGLAIKYINISQSEQDEIVQWVLQKQLELHKKGLL
ncbi:flagellar brake protein [Acetohalobium arabaticum]|uniref:Type IV pilus assembly PilZ n=1 Tax=Acetohalobium arabaticum (strain ATCC 49924 / DSM 5501 / Z-7288) TaxID=574087 RepID=D9QRI6_ACEAZ|nr:flagellar brake domain-containing protein [Acetohalobium arabaticum]ADL13127.1 type IV pilus assembly PilZ [Acetohalobium arabaticum DSM 5501]